MLRRVAALPLCAAEEIDGTDWVPFTAGNTPNIPIWQAERLKPPQLVVVHRRICLIDSRYGLGAVESISHPDIPMSTEHAQIVSNDPKKPVHHVLRFCDERERGEGIKAFDSFTPFQPITRGDFINTIGWDVGFEGQGLEVIRVSHKISETRDTILQETNVYCRWFDESAHGESSLLQ